MRWYGIVTGIFLILSIIDFAHAAPVPVQENRQEHIDVVHIPRDMITVLRKRLDEGLENLGEKYFKTGTHSPSSSAPSGVRHESTNVMQPQAAPNPASSTTDPDPLMEQSGSPSSSPKQGLRTRGGFLSSLKLLGDEWSYKSHEPMRGEMFTGNLPYDYVWDHKFTTTNPNAWLSIHPSADPNFNWEHWMNAEDPPPSSTSPRPAPIKEKGEASGYAPGSPPTEFHSYHGSVSSSPLSAKSQPIDLKAAIYAAKGKAKESRRISGTPRDVANAVQKELQPAERSLELGE